MEKPSSFGLLGMRERVWAIRGDITISGSHRGTRIEIRLPLPGDAIDIGKPPDANGPPEPLPK